MSDTQPPKQCSHLDCEGDGWYPAGNAIVRCDVCGRFASNFQAFEYVITAARCHDGLLAACEADFVLIGNILDNLRGRQNLGLEQAAIKLKTIKAMLSERHSNLRAAIAKAKP